MSQEKLKGDFFDWYINTSGQEYMPAKLIWGWIDKNCVAKMEQIQEAAKAVLSETMYFTVGENEEHFEDTPTYKDLEELLKHEVSKVKCDVCKHKWIAVRPLDTEKLECPNCGNICHFENEDE